MVKSTGPRFSAASLIALIPSAGAILFYAARGQIPPLTAFAAILSSIALGVLGGYGIARGWRQRAERLEAIATALGQRTPPSHLLPDERDEISVAERHLLDAADSVVSDVKALGEQREEFEAILRSMYEAVVVTGPRLLVILLFWD